MSLFNAHSYDFNVSLDGSTAIPCSLSSQRFTDDGKLSFVKTSDASVITGYFGGFTLDGVLINTSRDGPVETLGTIYDTSSVISCWSVLDPSSIKQGTDGSGEYAVGQPVGTWNDLVGSNNLVAATDGERATGHADGISYNGSSSKLFSSTTTGFTSDMTLVVSLKVDDNFAIIFADNAGFFPYIQTAGGGAGIVGAGTPTASVNQVALSDTLRGTFETALNTDTYLILTIEGADLSAWNSFITGNLYTSSYWYNGLIHTLVLMDNPSSGEISSVEAALASEVGVSL